MKIETRRKRTPMRMRTATDANGATYELQEWRELVSVKELSGWSPWQPYQGHGQAMTHNGVELDRINSSQWSLGYPPVELTVLE